MADVKLEGQVMVVGARSGSWVLPHSWHHLLVLGDVALAIVNAFLANSGENC